ncbi:MAG: cyanophycinase [Planctomycetota bacterium]
MRLHGLASSLWAGCVAVGVTVGLAWGAAAGPVLVIVGGALQAENEAVFRAVLDRVGPEGRLGVLPTASGVPAETGPKAVGLFETYAGPGQVVELIDIRHDTPEKAMDASYAERIAACDGLWFVGGVQSRIVAVFRPEGRDTPAYAAVLEVLERGGVVGGTSAGAAMMSDPMVRWGNSHEALLIGRSDELPDWGVGVGRGMGLLPFGVTDQHFVRRGRLGRLVVALETSGETVGFGVGENSALVVDLDDESAEVIGEPGVVAVELGEGAFEPMRVWHFEDGHAMRFELGGNGWSLVAEQDSAIDAATAAQAFGGRPRAYEGPDIFEVGVEDGVVTLSKTEAFAEVQATTQAAWDEAMKESMESAASAE